MEAIRTQATEDAKALRSQIPAKFVGITEFMASLNANPATLGTRFAVKPSETTQMEMNAEVATALERTQAEVAGCIADFSTIELWLHLTLPSIEDGNNFGVGIVMEGAKMIADKKKELTESLKGLPDYFKERSAAAEKLSPKVSSSSSESTSNSSDNEKKGAEETATSKNGTSSSSKKDIANSAVVPDAVAHIVALDVNWYIRLHATCDKVRSAYATVCDFLEKNEARISEPKGSGGRMNMY